MAYRPHTIEQKTELVLGAVRNITRAQAIDLAAMCLLAETLGINASVWHNSALYFGHRCNCGQCHPIKGAFAYRRVA